MSRQRLVDGPDDLDRLGPVLVTCPCPRCGVDHAVDVVELVRSTPSTYLLALQRRVGPAWLARVADQLAEVSVEIFDSVPHLRSTDGLAVSLAATVCRSCGAGYDIVLSWGEFQPGRWRLVLEGLVLHEGP